MPSELHLNRRTLAVLIALGVVVLVGLLYVARRPEYVDKEVRLSEVLSAAIFLAEAAGTKVKEVRELKNSEIGQLSKGLTKEGKSEYVTVGDRASHEIITSGLKLVWPSLRYQSEETDTKVVLTSIPPKNNPEVSAVKNRDEKVRIEDLVVWIDPLDATQEYTEGRDHPELLQYVTVMICIAVKGIPIAGVIHQPYGSAGESSGAVGMTYWSWVNHGVSSTLKSQVSSPSGNKVRVIFSRSHMGDVTSVAKAAFEDTESIKAAGAGYKSLAVALGKADLYLHTTAIKKWDVCAGDALLRAVGGRMTTRKGEELEYMLEQDQVNENGIVAAMLDNHATYLDKLKL